MNRFLTLIVIFISGIVAFAQSPVIGASLDSTDILVGEQATLTVRATVKAKAHVQFPEYANGYLVQDSVEILERSAIDTSEIDGGSRWVLTRNYLLTSFDSALYALPHIEVDVDGHKYESGNMLALKVGVVPVDTMHPDSIRDPYGAVEAEFHFAPGMLLETLIMLLLGFACWLAVKRINKPAPTSRVITITPPPPAHKVALKAIEKFQGREANSIEEMKEYYDQLTDILRVYLRDRFGINAKEMTSAQILEAIHYVGDERAISELRDLLQRADLVKFAKVNVDMLDNNRSLMEAMQYVNDTKQDETLLPQKIEKVIPPDLKAYHRKRYALIGILILLVIVIVGLFTHICYVFWESFF